MWRSGRFRRRETGRRRVPARRVAILHEPRVVRTMRRSSRLKDWLATVGFMFAVTLVFIAAVSALYLSTQERVRRNESLYLKRAVMEAVGVDRAYERTPEDVSGWYDRNVRERSLTLADGGQMPVYMILDPESGALRGLAAQRVGNGLWGKILSVVGLNATLDAISGVAFVSQNETPGLGARITENWFRRQFRGKTGPFELVPEGTHSASAREMDAITGATITSAGVRDMLNRALRELPEAVRHDGAQNATAPVATGAASRDPGRE